MSDVSWHEEAAKQARTLQIIDASLVMGCVFFLLIVLAIGPVARQPPPFLPIPLTTMACGLVGIELIAQLAIARGMAAKARRAVVNGAYQPIDPRRTDGQSSPASYLMAVFQTKTIVSGALFEGLAFFCIITYLIEGNVVALAVALLMILGVAAQFPTPSRIIAWVERQIEIIEQEKML